MGIEDQRSQVEIITQHKKMSQQSESEWPQTEELCSIMEHRDVSAFHKNGGATRFYEKLHTSPDGLDSQNLQKDFRQNRFSLLYKDISFVILYYFFVLFNNYLELTSLFTYIDMASINSLTRNLKVFYDCGSNLLMILHLLFLLFLQSYH